MNIKKKMINIMIPVAAVLVAFIIGGIIMACLGTNPFAAYVALIKGAFGSPSMIAQTLVISCPLMFTSLAAVFAYKCGVFNLGGEGQFVMGAVASVFFALKSGVNGVPGILFSLLCGALAGGLWAAIPGILKIKRGLNEMIVSIMLNYIAVLFMSFVYTNVLRDGSIPQTAEIDNGLKLAVLSSDFRVHIGILIAVVIGIVLNFVIYKTAYGFKVRAVGINSVATKVNGYSVKTIVLSSFILSGAIAGVGGSIELHGKQYRLLSGFGDGFGFDGVAIALIAQLNPVAALIVAFLFGVLRKGSNALQVTMGVPTAIVEIIQALIIIFAVAGTAAVKSSAIKQFMRRHSFKQKANVATEVIS